MFFLNVWITVKDPTNVERVGKLLASQVPLTRAEPGCVRFEVYHSQADAQRFLLVECWKEKADWERHRLAKAFTEIYAPQVLPLVDREPHISTKVE
jgi:quinol monooxygenase YgiN